MSSALTINVNRHRPSIMFLHSLLRLLYLIPASRVRCYITVPQSITLLCNVRSASKLKLHLPLRDLRSLFISYIAFCIYLGLFLEFLCYSIDLSLHGSAHILNYRSNFTDLIISFQRFFGYFFFF